MAIVLLEAEPIDLRLVDNDLVITNGQLEFSSGLAGVAQGIRIRLQMIRGEWFADLDAGVPLFERDGVTGDEAILGRRFDELKARAAMRDAILGTPGVLGILSMSAEYNNATRTIKAAWEARTVFGDTDLEALEFVA